MLLAEADWPQIEDLRERVSKIDADSLQAASQAFCRLFTAQFSSVVLARVFVVVPLKSLPAGEQAFARRFVHDDERLNESTPVLSLLGTSGNEDEWNDRAESRGHLAIPLLDSRFVQDAPMIAKLLADLEVDLKNLDDGRPIVTRLMLGGRNASFFVADAPKAVDAKNRAIIPAQDFVHRHGVRTVFGMGGAYVEGMMVITIIFSQEALARLTVDRFPSLISNFKMRTSQLVANKAIYAHQ